MIKLFKENYKILKTNIFGCRLGLKIIFMHIFYNLIFKIKNIFRKKNYKDHPINNHINTFLEYGYLKLENVISDSLFNIINQRYFFIALKVFNIFFLTKYSRYFRYFK